MRYLLSAALLAALTLAACDGYTTDATDTTGSSAVLHGTISCAAGDGPGELWFRYRPTGSSGAWSESARSSYPASACPYSGTLDRAVGGLSQQTVYDWQICGYGAQNSPTTVACKGQQGGPDPDTFRTCKQVANGTSFSAAMSGVGSGQCVTLAAGTYSWGDYSPPTGVTINAAAGTVATIVGEARVSNDNVTLRNLYLRPDPSETHAVLYINGDGDNFVGDRLDITADHLDFVMPVLSSGTPDNATLEDSKVHGAFGSGCFSPGTGSRTHAIYWSAGQNARFERVWLYDYSGYGLHFYGAGSVDGTQVDRVISDSRNSCSSSLGNVKDTGGADSITVNKSIVQGGGWRCLDGGVTITGSRVSGGMSGCTDGGGNTTASTSFNSTTDLRVPGNPDFQWVPGPQ